MSERGGRQSQGQEKMSRKKQNKEIKEVKEGWETETGTRKNE